MADETAPRRESHTVTVLRGDGLSADLDPFLTSLREVGTTEPGRATGDPAPTDISLGRLQALAELGVGGMGRVIEARDPHLGRAVAVKMLLHPAEVTERQLTRFITEAQVTAQLEHPHIVPVYEIGVNEADEVFFVMQKVVGVSLRQVLAGLRQGAEDTQHWTRHRLLTAFVKVCQAVAYAHDRGVLHRDIKPGNIMLGEFGEVLLLDWGVARVLGDAPEDVETLRSQDTSRPGTQDGSTLGTPGYMSPEQARGEFSALDGRSDVWSLGAVLYELLTLTAPFEGSRWVLLAETVSAEPVPPRERAPDRAIPVEIAETAARALRMNPDDRFASAEELADAVESFLAGSRRREAARRHLREAEEAWSRRARVTEAITEATEAEKTLAARIEPWRPIVDKAELMALRARIAGLRQEWKEGFDDVLFSCEQALSQDADNADVHAFLAQVHYARFEEAERDRDREAQHLAARRVRSYDRAGAYAARMRGTGAITLRTEPAGASVVLERYDQSAPLVWPLGDRAELGQTPLDGVPLEQGSYRLTLRLPGYHDAVYPVRISRGHHWQSGERPVKLLAEGSLGPDECYIPAGPVTLGGDPDIQKGLPLREAFLEGFVVQRQCVTMGEYAEFLTTLAVQDPERAWALVPRAEGKGATQYWARPEPGHPYVVPDRDAHGDRWYADWPITGLNWEDVQVYLAWRRERDGLPWRLPTEAEWEKAARGVDERLHPWGNGFDATLCRMAQSRPGRPQPARRGEYPTDRSPYEVLGMSGNMKEYCDADSFNGAENLRPLRGGSWMSQSRVCRVTCRHGMDRRHPALTDSFRMVRSLEPPC